MALWMVRAGKHGEHETKFFDDSKVYLTWSGPLQEVDLSKAKDYDDMKRIVTEAYPSEGRNKLGNWTSQIWPFVKSMKSADWVVVPQKSKRVIAFGEITGGYTYTPSAPTPYRHSRAVKWLNQDVARTAFDQDLLFSFGAFMTVCEIKRHDAENRIRAMAKSGWTSAPTFAGTPKTASSESTTTAVAEDTEEVDLEQLARDQIANLISRRFKGHEMARLVEALLKAQGYTTFTSPPGPDKGVDILAAPGALGFGSPRICVQVKSQEGPLDASTLNQLIGTMQNVQAQQGLLVGWGGFKTSVDREVAAQFFRVRLWNQNALIDQVLEHYDALDPDLRAELPLKRIWTIAREDEE